MGGGGGGDRIPSFGFRDQGLGEGIWAKVDGCGLAEIELEKGWYSGLWI